MKLQIGSSISHGIYKEKEWVNLDIANVRGVNVQANASALPFSGNSFAEIHCIHMLEHLTRDLHIPVLSEMERVLEPGGVCYIEVPDFEQSIKRIQSGFDKGDMERVRVWTLSVYGKTERPGMAHHWGFHKRELQTKMIEAGFSLVEDVTDKFISNHHKMEPVLLVKGTK